MIIFDIDNVLANVDHRKHFIDPEENENFARWNGCDFRGFKEGQFQLDVKWKPDYKGYDAACDEDEPIQAVLDVFIHLTQGEPFNHDVQIWSGRSESVRDTTLKWLTNLSGHTEDIGYWDRRLKMRPIGNAELVCDLKNRWMFERSKIDTTHRPPGIKYDPGIEMVFDSDPDSIAMWRRHGIFVFDCRQKGD